MAFSKAPEQDTYSAVRIPLTHEVYGRDGSDMDEDALNVFVEPVKGKFMEDKRVFVIKRAGSAQQVATVAASTIRGMYFWADQSKILYAVDNDIYVYNVNTGAAATISNPWISTSGHVGFCEFLYDNGTTVICATDGVTLITIDTSNVVVTCVDVDFPSPHLPYPVFLDGYLFIAKTGTASIYNSDLNDPVTWTAGALIDAEMEGDLLTRICKVNNYIAAFGTRTIEYFWDAANDPPGSPLQRNDTPIKLNRLLGGFAEQGNVIYFVGMDANGLPEVYALRDFKLEELGSATLKRYLAATTDGYANWKAGVVSYLGHSFYVLNAGTTRTYAMDVDTKFWGRVAYQAQAVFPLNMALTILQTAGYTTWFSLTGATSPLYKFSDTLYQDASTNFTCQGMTKAYDFGTMNRKYGHRLSILADRPGATSNLSVSWSDDDYTTFNTAIDVNLNQDLPSIQRLGWFRQRAFKYTYTDNYPLRLMEFELDLNKGSN